MAFGGTREWGAAAGKAGAADGIRAHDSTHDCSLALMKARQAWDGEMRASLACRAGFAGCGTAVVRATERNMLASSPSRDAVSARSL